MLWGVNFSTLSTDVTIFVLYKYHKNRWSCGHLHGTIDYHNNDTTYLNTLKSNVALSDYNKEFGRRPLLC